MFTFVIAFALSLVAALFVVRYSYLHGHITAYFDLDEVQKFHISPVPRIGGLALVTGMLGAFGFRYF